MQKYYDGKAIEKGKVNFTPMESGSFNPSAEGKSGKGTNGDGSVKYLSKVAGNDTELTTTSVSGKGPKVDAVMWKKASDRSLTTGS